MAPWSISPRRDDNEHHSILRVRALFSARPSNRAVQERYESRDIKKPSSHGTTITSVRAQVKLYLRFEFTKRPTACQNVEQEERSMHPTRLQSRCSVMVASITSPQEFGDAHEH
jgi:hypothetical protein